MPARGRFQLFPRLLSTFPLYELLINTRSLRIRRSPPSSAKIPKSLASSTDSTATTDARSYSTATSRVSVARKSRSPQTKAHRQGHAGPANLLLNCVRECGFHTIRAAPGPLAASTQKERCPNVRSQHRWVVNCNQPQPPWGRLALLVLGGVQKDF